MKIPIRNKDKQLTIPLRIALGFIMLGVIFKVIHYPGSIFLLFAGYFSIIILYPIRFALKQPKAFVDYIKLTYIISSFIYFVFALLRPEITETVVIETITKYAFKIISGLSIVVWFVLEGFTYFSDDEDVEIDYWSNGIYGFALALVLLGSGFKLMHFPYSFELLVVGFAVGVFWVFKDFSFNDKSDTD